MNLKSHFSKLFSWEIKILSLNKEKDETEIGKS